MLVDAENGAEIADAHRRRRGLGFRFAELDVARELVRPVESALFSRSRAHIRSRLSSSASKLFGLATESCEPDVIVCTVDRIGVMIHSVTKPEITSRIA